MELARAFFQTFAATFPAFDSFMLTNAAGIIALCLAGLIVLGLVSLILTAGDREVARLELMSRVDAASRPAGQRQAFESAQAAAADAQTDT